LGGIRVRITDSAGVERWAPLFYAGVGSVNFLIDAETAVGQARLELVRSDGRPNLEGSVIVSRVAPGFFTGTMNARGPVIGELLGGEKPKPLWNCDATGCRTVPIPVADSSATIRLFGTGFRQAARIQATIGGLPVKVLRAGPRPDNGYDDELVLELSDSLKGIGEQDLLVFADDRVSNVVRIRVE
jgi:uncharacterized protein (TIGR03437 family)